MLNTMLVTLLLEARENSGTHRESFYSVLQYTYNSEDGETRTYSRTVNTQQRFRKINVNKYGHAQEKQMWIVM